MVLNSGAFFGLVVAALVATVPAASAQGVETVEALQPVVMSDVYARGGDGYPEVRIPAVVVTPKSTLLAFAEARQGDDHSENDIVLKRSMDGGATWGPLQLIAEMGGDSLNDPCAVVLPETGRVLLMYQRYPKGYHTRKMKHTEPAETGYGGPRNTQTFLTRSDDDGVTWSEPEDITRSLRRPDVISLGSPGVGIQLEHGPHRGRILLPIYEVMPEGEKRGWYNCAGISDDGGVTWRPGGRVPEHLIEGDANECQIAELSDGTIVMDARQTVGTTRLGAVSRDAGESWNPMYDVPDLVTPPCMASLIRFDAGEGDLLMISGPNTLKPRENGTLFISRDDGKTWPGKHVLYPGEFAYSCLVQLPDNRIGCLFERDDYSHITFAVYDVAALTSGQVSRDVFSPGTYGPDYHVSTRDIKHGKLLIRLAQVKTKEPSARVFSFCKAWLSVTREEREIYSEFFPEIDPVGSSYGLFVPKNQPPAPWFAVVKAGDYDGRLFLVHKNGQVYNLKGGLYFITKNKRYLFSEYYSDMSELDVFDLKAGRIALSLEGMPDIYHWYRWDSGYFFTAPDNEHFAYTVDLSEKRLVKKPITASELASATKVDYAFEPSEERDCDCSQEP